MSDEKEMLQHDLEEAILRLLQTGDTRLGNPGSGLVSQYVQKLRLPKVSGHRRVAAVLWELMRRGLLYLSFADNPDEYRSDPAWWTFFLTPRGEACVAAGPVTPDVPGSYLDAFARDLPQAPDVVRLYVREALDTYHQQNFLASAVMLGVAAEAAFLDLVESLCNWSPAAKEAPALRKALNNRQTTYSSLLRDFRRVIDQHHSDVPADLLDGLGIQLVAVLELIKNYRNDAGHPTGVSLDRATCHVCLTNFKVAMERLYALKTFFIGSTP